MLLPMVSTAIQMIGMLRDMYNYEANLHNQNLLINIKEKYKTVGEALKLFKDDELLSEPGERFTFA